MGDVAALAGVSRKTVSRVFNSEPTVAAELVLRVRRAAEQLNYKMNLVASDLRRSNGRPSTIGLLIQDVSNEFSASIFRSVENVAEQQGVTVLASNVDEDPQRERELTAALITTMSWTLRWRATRLRPSRRSRRQLVCSGAGAGRSVDGRDQLCQGAGIRAG